MGGILVLQTLAALASAGLTYQVAGAIRDRRRFAAPGTLTPVGRHRLHVRCEGAGTPAVILEAGIAASSLTWSRVQPAIAQVTRVCSYDRAGLAWSESTSAPRSMESIVSELRLLLERTAVPPPYVLVGHSFGGLIIRAYARSHPAEVAGLVFVDPLHPEEWCEPSSQQKKMLRGGIFLSRVGAVLARLGIVRLSLALLSGGAPGAPRRFSRVFGRQAAALVEHMVGEVQKLPQDVLPSVQAHWSNPKAFRGMWQHLQAMPACSADLMRGTDNLANIPVIVLSAAERRLRWLEADEALARASVSGRHIIAPYGGHWVHLDHPDVLIEAISVLVSSTRTRKGRQPE
jgi:pimeloyl-ACP methyl ester carboxylesterase